MPAHILPLPPAACPVHARPSRAGSTLEPGATSPVQQWFLDRLKARKPGRATASGTAARDFHRQMAAAPDARGRLDVASGFLGRGPEVPGYEQRVRGLADALVRNGTVSTAPGYSAQRLLCDRTGRPQLAVRADTDPDASIRESMAAAFGQLLAANGGPPLAFDTPVPHDLHGHGPAVLVPVGGDLEPKGLRTLSPKALQTLALGHLFTNNWQADWDRQQVRADGRGWHLDAGSAFPEDQALGESLADMRAGGLAPLFRAPADATPAWDQPFDAGLAAQVRGLDTHALRWTLDLQLAQLRRAHPDAALSDHAAHRALDAIDTTREMLTRSPRMSLRTLLARYPQRLDWLAPGGEARSGVLSTEPLPNGLHGELLLRRPDGHVEQVVKPLLNAQGQAVPARLARGLREVMTSQLNDEFRRLTGVDLGYPRATLTGLDLGAPAVRVAGLNGTVPDHGVVSDPSRRRHSPLAERRPIEQRVDRPVEALTAARLQRLMVAHLATGNRDLNWARVMLTPDGEARPFSGDVAFPNLDTRGRAHLRDRDRDRQRDGAARQLAAARFTATPGQVNLPAADAPMDGDLAAALRELDVDTLESRLLTGHATLMRRAGRLVERAGVEASTLFDGGDIRAAMQALRHLQAIVRQSGRPTMYELVEALGPAEAPRALPAAAPAALEPTSTSTRHGPSAFMRLHQAVAIPTRPASSRRLLDPALRIPSLIDGNELSALLREAAPFSLLARRDRVLAPLLRDAVGLRLKKDDGKQRAAAQKLRGAAVQALSRLSARVDALGPGDKDEAGRLRQRLQTLSRLIVDTEQRYRLEPLRPARA